MKTLSYLVGAGCAATLMLASAAQATTVVVLPGDTSWKSTNNTGGGSSAITGVEDRSGDGSLELHGDKTRFQYGGTSFLASSLGSFGNVVGLGFDWMIGDNSTNPLNVDYTPALRLNVKSGFTTKELVWEGAYNGVYGPQTVDNTWYTVNPLTAKFYIGAGNENAGKTLAQWAADMGGYSVIGISVGVGSSASAGYYAYADNVRLVTNTSDTTWNFNVSNAAVPEPSTWAMLIIGFGAVGGTLRTRRRTGLAAA